MPDRDRPAHPTPRPAAIAGIADLLAVIENEPVPDRLLALARALQAALHDRSPDPGAP